MTIAVTETALGDEAVDLRGANVSVDAVLAAVRGECGPPLSLPVGELTTTDIHDVVGHVDGRLTQIRGGRP